MEEVPTPRRDFPAFPFEAYSIQNDFMNFLYGALDKGGIAMLESPTGTGKTLSIICSAMQWVVDQRQKKKSLQQREESVSSKPKEKSGNVVLANDDGDEDEPDWMRDFDIATAEEEVPRRSYGRGLGDCERKPSVIKSKKAERIRAESRDDDEEEEFLVEDYESDEESFENGRPKRKGRRCLNSSSSEEEENEVEDEEGEEVMPKVYFTSRTHSQLSQFVKEFNRTAFASELKLVCLGSRKNMCTNPEVLKLGNANRINERCLELQKNRKDAKVKVVSADGKIQHKKPSSGCPMLRKQKLQNLFRTEVWKHEAMDIEDLVQLGSKIGTCSYYGTRDMIRAADIVVLPYQSLLLRSARESLALNLKNSVIVIDEAHNLADSLTGMYNTKITQLQLNQVQSHLEFYLDRFRTRLGAGSRRYIQTLIVLTQSFLQLLLGHKDDACDDGSSAAMQSHVEKLGDASMTINDFLFSLNIDNINIVKLHKYVKESNIIHKVSGYGTKLQNLQSNLTPPGSKGIGADGSILSSFRSLVDIIISLVNNDKDGRIIVSRQKLVGERQEGYIKFVMLSGDAIFSEIVKQVHALVLAGGTLQPIEETRVRLFPHLSLGEVHFFSCNHIVPPESILPIAVSRGPSGLDFDFSYSSRSFLGMIEELGRLICNLVAIVPEGLVVFFSSFDYEGQVYDAWKASGVISKILRKKILYREPRSSNEVELVLRNYKEAITSCSGTSKDSGTNGAILLAVVGGKVSEGINFSDGMGRCVVMVGLPYPSPTDVELIERIKHIEGLGEATLHREDNNVKSGFDILRRCKRRGREYYENLCMKAVNQSIGRAIRHINDYASILLVDSRYAHNSSDKTCSHPTDKLPFWIKHRLVSAKSYGEVHRMLHQFFQFNKQKTSK